jgi:hypothetical protein
MAGTFTFSGSSSDVVSYRWGLSSPPTTVATPATMGGSAQVYWTPSAGGAKTLYVQAVDQAGRTSGTRMYQFYVGPPSTALARWKLDEPTGATTLADDTGHGYTMTVNGAATLGVPGRLLPGQDGQSRTAMSFGGDSTDYAITSGPVLAHTSSSFTVSAWVKLGDATANHTVLAQRGTNTSAFYLEYNQDAGGLWKFTMTSVDSTTPQYQGALSVSTPKVGVWTHLVGMYDSDAQSLSVYVNGVKEGTLTGVSTWDATGPMRISTGGNPWNGSVGEVQVWDRTISAAEISALSDPLKVSAVADWHFDEVGPGPAYDSSGMVHDLNFYNGAVIPPTGAGQTGTGLSLDGVDDYASPDEPVVATDPSFTVSAWFYLTESTAYHTGVSQDGALSSGFLLKYSPRSGQWSFALPDSDTIEPTQVSALGGAPAFDTYTHLVGVYDAYAGEARLYVNGVLKGATAVPPRTWSASGPLTIGRTQWDGAPTDWWQGNIDEVRIYQGAVTDVTAIP